MNAKAPCLFRERILGIIAVHCLNSELSCVGFSARSKACKGHVTVGVWSWETVSLSPSYSYSFVENYSSPTVSHFFYQLVLVH